MPSRGRKKPSIKRQSRATVATATRTWHTGPNGGKYYVADSGRKVYASSLRAGGGQRSSPAGGGGTKAVAAPSRSSRASTRTASPTRAEVRARSRSRSRGRTSAVKLEPGTLLGSKTVVGETHVRAWSPKRNREYEHILESELERGRPESDARRIAAATVNRIRSLHGETRS